MKPVSAAYRKSMQQTMRNRSYARVTIFIEDSTAAQDGQWADNGVEPYSSYDTLDFSYNYDDPTYATLELNRWELNGSQVILPAGKPAGGYTEQGFVSSKISGGDGNFSDPAVLRRKFSVDHALHGLTITFDSRCNAWPAEIMVRFMLAGEVVDVQEASITALTTVITTEVDYVDELEIVFTRCLPFHRPRVEYVLYGLQTTYTGNAISSVTQKHDVDPLSRRLPAETAQVRLLDYNNDYDPDNPRGIFRYVEEKARLRIQHGYTTKADTVEWLRSDEYLSDGKPSTANHIATFTATGIISSLSDTFYKSKPGRKSLYDMAEEVLQDAGLTPTASGGNPWKIDESLKEMFTDAMLPIDSHMNCLKLIAHAARSTLYTDDENIIHVTPFGVTVKGIYSGEWTDNGHVWYSEWDTVDTGTDATLPLASMEINRWVLDGSMGLLSAVQPEQRGYISAGLIGTTGSEDPGTAPMFSKTFDVSHDLSVLALQFDTLAGDFPNKVQVRYYKDDALIDTRTEEVLDTTAYIFSDAANDCTRFEVYMLSGLPYHRFRVSKVYYREDDFTLNFDTITEGTLETTKIDKLRAVTVAVYSYVRAENPSKIYEATTDQTALHVEFSGPAEGVVINVSGGSLLSAKIYGQAADLELSAGTKTVTVTGYVLEQSSAVLTYTNSPTGEIDAEENPLITDYDMALALAKHFATYLTMRNTYDAAYRGNPELETRDIIGVQTGFTDEMEALILVNEITYNGALSGRLKVKGLI